MKASVAYKIVYRDLNGSLASSEALTRKSSYNITYHPDGRMIYPKVGRIFLFDTEANARQAMHTLGYSLGKQEHEIWQVTAYNAIASQSEVPTQNLLRDEYSQSLLDIWQKFVKTRRFYDNFRSSMQGIVYARAVRMVKKV